MAKFTMELPKDLQEDVMYIYDNLDRICGQMTRAGAKVVMETVKARVPKGIADSEMMKCLKLTKTYKTPSDDGINTKVGFYGYFVNKEGVKTPAPLVANVYEYGRSNLPFPKQPFFRDAFQDQMITRAMLVEQEKASKGLLK